MAFRVRTTCVVTLGVVAGAILTAGHFVGCTAFTAGSSSGDGTPPPTSLDGAPGAADAPTSNPPTPHRIYVAGGDTFSQGTRDLLSDVLVANQNADGSLSAWSATTGTAATFHAATLVFRTTSSPGGTIPFLLLGGELGTSVDSVATSRVMAGVSLSGNGEIPSWTQATPFLPEPIGFHASVVVGGRAFVLGGQLVGGLATASVHHTSIGDGPSPGITPWEPTTALPAPRRRLAAATNGAQIFVVGGSTPNAPNDDTCQTEIVVGTVDGSGAINQWTAATGASYAGTSAAAAVHGSKLIVAGGGLGCSGAPAIANHVRVARIQPTGALDPFVDSFSLPEPVRGLALVVLGDFLYAIGGDTDTGPSKTVAFAALDANGIASPWKLTTSLPNGRAFFAVAGY